jgi:ribosomal protein S18 acetylase RimI-like enzyme
MAMLSLRPMQAEDQAFPYQVYASTRLDEMAMVDWSPEQKEAFLRMQFDLRTRQYQAEYPDAVTEIILCDDIPVGAMTTVKTTEAILLMDIALLPEFRGAGISSTILHNLQKKNKKIILHVLRQNPAIHLYSRLGFLSVSEYSMYLQMEWNPQ